MTSDLDIGPLSWVKSEIDLALERAAVALDEHAQNPGGQALSGAVKQLHQAHGALTIVGLDGITEFSAALENLFAKLGNGEVPWSDSVAGIAKAGLKAMRGYLDGLMDGDVNQPLRLMPAYSELLVAAGSPKPGLSALFFPDLSQRPPKRETDPPILTQDKLSARIKMARMGYERGLLKWLKTPAEAARGLAEMKNSVFMIEATRIQPADRAFWWASLGFLETLADGALPAPDEAAAASRLALRIGAQIKHLSEGDDDVPDRLMADVLYLVAIGKCGSPLASTVRAAYRLDVLIPEATANTDLEALKPHIRKLRELLSTAREDWTRLCSGVAAALPPFHETVTQAGQQAGVLGNASIQYICQSLVTLTDALRRDPMRHNDTMAIEVATALMLCDSALENFQSLDSDFDKHAHIMEARLLALANQEDLDTLDLPHLDAMARRAQERILLATVAREIQANLATVEQTLDAYFRDHGKHSSLAELSKPLKQIEGALMILGQDKAVAVLSEAMRHVADLAKGTLAADTAVFESIAGKLSGIGFFIEELEHGGNPDIQAILNPRKPGVAVAAEPAAEAVVEAIAPVVADLVEAVAPTVAAPPVVHVAPTAAPEPAPAVPEAATVAPAAEHLGSDEEFDVELLEIFLEEATEVLTTIGMQLPEVRANPQDIEALTTMRRSFHTLKGSGRMVNLYELGEVAWGAEQVLNLWLQEKRPATPALLAMIELALNVFGPWLAQLGAGGSGHYDAANLVASTSALLAGVEIEAPAAVVTSDDSPDARSMSELLADMELRDAAAEAEKVESALVAAELAIADISAEAAHSSLEAESAVSPAPTSGIDAEARDIATQPVVDLTIADLRTIDAEALPPHAAVSDEELLAAELAAAEVLAEGAQASEESARPATEPQAEAKPIDGVETAEILPFPTQEPVRIGDLEISPTLFAIYTEEAQQHLSTIQREIGSTGVPSDSLIRAAHTLGSTSGTTGVTAIFHLARALELALGSLSIVDLPPTEAQRLLLARCAGALEGMFGAVMSRRLPGEEAELATELRNLKPESAPAPSPTPVQAEVASTSATPVPIEVSEAPSVAAVPSTSTTPTQPESPLEFALPDHPPAEQAPPPPLEEEEEEEHRHSNRLIDEIDEQLLPIFLEEASDLMASLDAQLRGWRGQPENDAFSKQMQRDLHTIKGSARMAGAMGCGDLFHSMESRIEQATALRAINSDLFDSLEVSYDRGAMLIERLQRGEFGAPEAPPPAVAAAAAPATIAKSTSTPGIAAGAPAPVAATMTTSTAAGAATTAPVAASAAQKAQIQLRVRADLIDSLVNEAGEVAIARARIEGEMRALKTSLLELTDNVIRLRHQVREIEIQAETQMASQITELKAQAEIEGRAFDPLEFDRFTRFQELTRMMAESVNDVSTVQHTLLSNVTNADASLSAQARINRELSQRLMGVRMMPFDSLAERLHRVVRQAAKDVGKRANLDIKGGQMGIDRSVLEHIGGPLEHLLRNCLAHGIEEPAKREAAGKEVFGQVTLSLAQEGNDVVLALADDGAGLNLKKIRERAIERGLLTENDPTDDAHLIGMIFQSGFSTADAVSTISGRGVGMDVVKTEIEGLGGRIEVTTTSGKGSIFRLYLPLTLAVSQAVIILVGSRQYALPASMVEQVSELKPAVIDKLRREGTTEWLGRKYPYRYLPNLLGMRDAKPVPARRHWLLLVKGGAERLAIEVDGMIGNREIVIKNLGQQLRRISGLAGATVLSNGEIGLILNPIALYAKQLLVESAEQQRLAESGPATASDGLATEQSVPAPTESQILPARKRRRQPSDATVMVVDDSLTVRKVTGRLLGRQGYQVVTAKDGVDALEQLGDLIPDVMLLDIEMPRMDGFELARNIRADHKLKNIPIIMITSRSADKHRQYAMEIGVNHYIGKPYDEGTLLGLIDLHVNPEFQKPAP
jgi:chemosensory pili system protein ChpA (sensor histidine kinase/response regulator)